MSEKKAVVLLGTLSERIIRTIVETVEKQILDDASCQIILEEHGQEKVSMNRKENTACYTILFRKIET